MHNLYKLESESSVKYPTSVQCGPSYFRFNSKNWDGPKKKC